MNEKKGILKFLNLFDIIVIVVIAVLAAVLIFVGKEAEANKNADAGAEKEGTVTYVIEFKKMGNGSEKLIKVGDQLVDKIKKYSIGTVVDVEVKDAVGMKENIIDGTVSETEYPEGKDVYVTVEAPCTENEYSIVVGGGYIVRVGKSASVRGPGYSSPGYIVDVVRGDG